jgi:hypothetical protein
MYINGPLNFKAVASWEASIENGDRTLLVYIRTDGPFMHRVFAVEAPTNAVGGDTPLATLFAQHGHAVINEHAQHMMQAIREAQDYAVKWEIARSNGGGIEDCGCEVVKT